MKPQIALSPAEMAELQLLGLDCSDASMCWCKEPNENKYRLFIHDEYCYEAACLHPIPAYTLEDMICKLMITIGWIPRVNKPIIRWIARRFGFCAYGDSPMEVAFEMLKWVLKNHPDKIKRL